MEFLRDNFIVFNKHYPSFSRITVRLPKANCDLQFYDNMGEPIDVLENKYYWQLYFNHPDIDKNIFAQSIHEVIDLDDGYFLVTFNITGDIDIRIFNDYKCNGSLEDKLLPWKKFIRYTYG